MDTKLDNLPAFLGSDPRCKLVESPERLDKEATSHPDTIKPRSREKGERAARKCCPHQGQGLPQKLSGWLRERRK